MADYIPRADGKVVAWAENFARLIALNPSTYGLMVSDSVAISGWVDAFVAARQVAAEPSTRTVSTVAAKDSARAAMLSVVRRYAQVIKLNDGVTNSEKIGLGLTVADGGRSPVPAPSTAPVCMIIGATPLRHTLRFSDAGSMTRRAKPPGAASLELHYFVGENPPPMPGGDVPTRFYGVATRQPFQVALKGADIGKRITYYARWVTRRGLAGPWSSPVGMTVAG